MRNFFTFSILGFLLFAASCAHMSNKIGVSREIEISHFAGQNFGGKTYQQLPLKPYEVVLTFDDGPDENVTPQILSALKNQNAKATFFMVGNQIAKNPQIARQVARDGHSIGLHSLSHISMRDLSDDAQIRDFQTNLEIAKRELGNNLAPLYRFPFLHDTQNLTQFLNKNGVNIISVDAMGYDWEANATTQSINEHIFKELDANNHSGIILLHDIQKASIAALPELLKELKARNYKIVAIKFKN